jgi:hypothetical protein
MNISSSDDLKSRFKMLFSVRPILTLAITFFIVFLPQFMYWKFAYGSFLADSYPGEGFTNISHPRIAAFLLSPHNGALLYCPLYAILFFCIAFLFKPYRLMSVAYAAVVASVIYLSASWYLFFFGCGFGARNLVEYSGALAFPLAWCFQNKRKLKYFISPLILVCVFLNLKLMANWDLCFWGKTDWSWKEYNYLLRPPSKTLHLGLDSLDTKKVLTLNNEKVYHIKKEEEYSPGFAFQPNDLSSSYFKRAYIEVDVMPLDSSKLFLVCMAFDGDSTAFYNSVEIAGKNKEWQNIRWFSGIPFDDAKNYFVKIFLMNKDKHEFYFRNFSVKLE